MKNLVFHLIGAGIIMFAFFCIAPLSIVAQQNTTKLSKYTFGEMKARHIGPATMSGRITCVDAVNSNPDLLYVGTAGGGVWKSKNAGTTYEPVFDDHIQGIGTITIDQDHPDTVWVGTGEVWTRNSVSVGDGIYKSTNGGKKWKNMGLKDSERIAKIIIHPRDPNIVFVAVLGHLWNGNEERGVYKTMDGGKNWEKILYVDENTGCADLAMDPENPDLIFAAMWDFRRMPYFFRSGGPGSGLFKSSDGGDTWEKIDKPFPEGTIGRTSVVFSPADPAIVWALVESENTGLYRSKDKGESWELMSSNPLLGARPFYFSLLVPDPVDTNRIYKPGFTLWVSDDGGKTFTVPFVGGGKVHSDLHALWIDPNNNEFMYCGTDGGMYLSHDRGNTWKFCRNLPVSTFYHVAVDDQKPYWVYGGLQDNGSWMAPSKAPGGIQNRNWEYIGYGDGFNAFRDNEDHNVIYFQYQGGNIKKRFKDTWEVKDIKPYADESMEELRFNWDTPLMQSSVDNTLYVGAQYLFKSNDDGDSWTRISPDLTTNDPDKLKQEETGGLTIDNSTAENHCTIYTIAESSFDSDVIWVGTDDGNLQLTTDGGETWKNLSANIPGLPPNTWCSSIEPGKFDKNVAYVTFDGHKQGDKTPYVYVTKDSGKTWTSLISDVIPVYCHIIREDTKNPNLLFLGTEFGLFVSIDQGESWVPFTGGIPKVSIRDMVIQPQASALVIATHGRGIVIIDDLTPIRELSREVIEQDVAFLSTQPFELSYLGYQGGTTGDDAFIGPNPSGALNIVYYLKKRHIFGDMYIEVFNQEGELLKKLTAGPRKGINMVPWRMRMEPPKVPSSVQILGQAINGPTYPPGEYRVKLTKGDDSYETTVSVVNDPELPHTASDRDLRYQTVMKAYDLLEDLAYLDKKIVIIRDKSADLANSSEVSKSLSKQLDDLSNKMDEFRKELLATKEGRITGEKRVRERIGNIYSNVMGFEGKPTDSQVQRLDFLEAEVMEYFDRADKTIEGELVNVNKQLSKAGKNEIPVLTRTEFMEE